MDNKILARILAKQGEESVYEFLTQSLSSSELNSLMMAVFAARSERISPADVLRSYTQNRFVGSVSYDPVAFAADEAKLLKVVQAEGFEIMDFSPLTPLGSSSALGTVDQKKIIAAGRNTEVISDITNVLALEIARRKKEEPSLKTMHASAAFRHIRGQQFDMPGFTPFFKILSLVSSGRDLGNYQMELQTIAKHIRTYIALFDKGLGIGSELLSLSLTSLYGENRSQLMEAARGIINESGLKIELKEQAREDNLYYHDFRFAIAVNIDGQFLEVIDGGSVSWTRQLLQNKKERMVISGLGTEYLYRLLNP
ncbi:MAG: hypothetical protein AAF587_07050 [Bacteroidota bacterium]